ncbi:hypothetical protein, partial [Paracoccus lutimaris]|uniref:hypothetical protein n=1 Tax=Paracoccus lutimaris TaxID=1490030 RepID=UPI0015F0FD99
ADLHVQRLDALDGFDLKGGPIRFRLNRRGAARQQRPGVVTVLVRQDAHLETCHNTPVTTLAFYRAAHRSTIARLALMTDGKHHGADLVQPARRQGFEIF